MKNKNRLLKILLFSILIIASLVTYLSYGVKEKRLRLNLILIIIEVELPKYLQVKVFY